MRSPIATIVLLSLFCMTHDCTSVRHDRPSLENTTTALHADVAWLAADARQGRSFDSPGLAASSEYIADRFRLLGLRPLSSLGTYFDAFNLVGVQRVVHASLAVNDMPVAEDSFAAKAAGSTTMVSGALAFVGYGIHAPARGYDDLAGIDLHGRIALAMIGGPPTTDANTRVTAADGYLDVKFRELADAGANAVILVSLPAPGEDPKARPRAFSGDSPIPCFWVNAATADRWLGGDGSLAMLIATKRQIDSTGRPHSRIVDGMMLTARVKAERQPQTPVWNVVGVLPGRGPHANEFVVVGAHYDHLGRRLAWPGERRGLIHPGADDNASGTAAMLALAARFAREGPRDRSIAFVAFTLEEGGMNGSYQFVRRNVLPAGSIAAMLNLDMIGRLRNQRLYVGGNGTAEAFDAILRAAEARSPIELVSIGRGSGGPSDHTAFQKMHVPSVFFFTGLHPDYHRPSDTTEKVNFDGLAQIILLAGDVVESLCTMDRPIYDDRYDAAGINVNIQSGELPTPPRGKPTLFQNSVPIN